MTAFRLPRFSPATRVATGLVSLMISLLLVVDVFNGLLPDRLGDAKRARAAAVAAIAAQVTRTLRHGRDDRAELQQTLASATQSAPQLRGASVVTSHGETLASVGAPTNAWAAGGDAHSTLDDMRAAILDNGRPWGELRIAFAPVWPSTLGGWMRDPLLQGMLLIAVLGFVSFQLYLRRVLRYLDPDNAVPERVRTAFDTLTEGVLVLDEKGQILLANKAFRSYRPEHVDRLTGLDAAALPWLVAGLPQTGDDLPWARVASDKRAVLGVALRIEGDEQPHRDLVMNCSPITNGAGRYRGCLATFSDVTELQKRKQNLRDALEELRASQIEIEKQNEELTRLATRDSLTGSLNRRSFMAEADQRFAEARQSHAPICVIMCDIDHFKSVNDRFGHAAGDRVIQAAVKALGRGLRVGDLLGRYGGEEFCILLPGASMPQALEIAERLRADTEANVGDAIREAASTRVAVTMSFGVAELRTDTPDPAQLIDLADRALYVSKKTGRNRVTAATALEPVGTLESA